MRNEFSSRLDVEVLGVHPKAEVVEGRGAFCRQNSVQKCLKKTGSSKKNVTKYQQLH